MKKILIILIILYAVGCTLYPVRADYQQSLKDYSFQFEQYRLLYQNHLVSKNKYLAYKSPISLAEALENGKRVLQQRDMVLITYFQTLKEKLWQTPEIENDVLINHASLIDSKISLLASHKDKVQSAIQLSDLTTISKEIENRQNDLLAISRKVLGTVLTAKVDKLKKSLDKNQDYLSTTIAQNASLLANVQNLERWLLEAKNKIILADEKIEQGRAIFNTIDQSNSFQIQENYNKGVIALLSANQYLKEALSFQKEVARSLTND